LCIQFLYKLRISSIIGRFIVQTAESEKENMK